MRHLLKNLPAFLCLLIPLGLLAWLGSQEMRRLENQVEKALHDHASAYLREVSAVLEHNLAQVVQDLLAEDLDLSRRSLVQAARNLIEAHPSILDLILLEPEGDLFFPVEPPELGAALPFHEPAEVRAVDDAEVLEALGDFAGARDKIEEFLDSDGAGSKDRPVAIRAHFTLAGLLRRERQLDAAEQEYLLAADLSMRRRSRSRPAQLNAIRLLCEVALAELDAERNLGHARMVDVMRDIADGLYDRVGEPLLQATFDRLRTRIPSDSPQKAKALDAALTQTIRETGRNFAAEYRSELREHFRRRLRQADPSHTLHAIHTSPQGHSLLAVRAIRASEKEDWLDPVAWIGLRLNLDMLLGDQIAVLVSPDAAEFQLTIHDPEGEQILASPDLGDLLPNLVEERMVSFAGLQLGATPVHPEAYLEARRDSIRNRALLFLVLCLVAVGGAFFLLRSVAREAELANLKVDLVSRVSHDLRTPLALIKMYSETIGLGRTKDQQQLQDFTGIISREADSLTLMIERVLDFSRRQQGDLHYEQKPTDLGELLSTVSDAYQPHLRARGFTLDSDLESDVIAHVDRTALQSAVVNLLENAIKYSQPNESSNGLAMRLSRQGKDAVLEILDRGIGIPEGERQQIFDSFYRASNAGEARGAGLGLNLVKHFVEAHGGTIEAQPRPGGGSIMRMTLPLKTNQPGDPDA